MERLDAAGFEKRGSMFIDHREIGLDFLIRDDIAMQIEPYPQFLGKGIGAIEGSEGGSAGDDDPVDFGGMGRGPRLRGDDRRGLLR